MFYITGLYRQWSDGQGVAPPPVVVTTPSVGHARPHKRRYILEDGRHVLLTLDELRVYLLKRLRKQEKPAKRPEQAKAPRTGRAISAEPAASAGLLSQQQQPTYLAVPRFDVMWQQAWVRNQPEVMAALRDIAQALETAAIAADDDEVEILLLS